MPEQRPEQLSLTEVLATGLEENRATGILKETNRLLSSGAPAEECWRKISKNILTPAIPFALHKLLYEKVYTECDPEQGPPPAWFPAEEEIQSTNLHQMMQQLHLNSYEELFSWTIEKRADFWRFLVERLGIRFQKPFTTFADLSDVESPRWLVGARLNIASSCFQAPEDSVAIYHQGEGSAMATMSYGQLHTLTNRVANGLQAAGYKAGDPIAKPSFPRFSTSAIPGNAYSMCRARPT